MNEAAENASKEALNILISELKKIKFHDAKEILKGEDNAATKYLERKSYDSLFSKFTPIVKKSMNKVQVYKYWNPLIKKYNSIKIWKFVAKINRMKKFEDTIYIFGFVASHITQR